MAGKSKVGVSVEEEGDAAQAAEKPAAGEDTHLFIKYRHIICSNENMICTP
jgi:hypothetical protein